MVYLYRILVVVVQFLLPVASLFARGKSKLFIDGRRNLYKSKQIKKIGKVYWFHCASLGEFEQARPVMEEIKHQDKTAQLVISFFSPSGYEQRKNYPLAEGVYYMPIDTPSNARKFIDWIQADVAIFVKYEIWYYHLKTLASRKIPTYLLSATFRENQFLFSFYGQWLFGVLKQFERIFLQDSKSFHLLESKGIENITLSGDTRYDRVRSTALASVRIELLAQFKGTSPIIILGSSWPEEEQIIKDVLYDSNYSRYKVIIAPHDVSESHIQQISELMKPFGVSRFTSGAFNTDDRVIILDTIGHLSNAYFYADIALIGGGFGRGLHNILEALAFGVPVVYGPEVDRYPEALESMASEVAYKVSNAEGLSAAINRLLPSGQLDDRMRAKCLDFINWHSGASDKVMKELLKGRH